MTPITGELIRKRQTNGVAKPPRLSNGDHLSLPEFEQRWDATPGLIQAELIEGIVFMPPPTSETHSASHDLLYDWLRSFARATSGVASRFNTTVRLDNRNEYQPDCLLRLISPILGRSRISEDDYLEGPPELVAEVAVSSAGYDAHEKRLVYERAGVQEYILWQVMDARCDWWSLEEGVYQTVKLRADGLQRSKVFPGLWLDPAALLAGDGHRLEKVLQRGLKSREHHDFVQRLKAK